MWNGKLKEHNFAFAVLVQSLHAVNICKPLARSSSTCWNNKSYVCYSHGNSFQGNHREVGGTGSQGAAEPPPRRGRFTNTQTKLQQVTVKSLLKQLSSEGESATSQTQSSVREQPQIQTTASTTTSAQRLHSINSSLLSTIYIFEHCFKKYLPVSCWSEQIISREVLLSSHLSNVLRLLLLCNEHLPPATYFKMLGPKRTQRKTEKGKYYYKLQPSNYLLISFRCC